MGNRLPGGRARRKPSGSASAAGASHQGMSSSSAAGHVAPGGSGKTTSSAATRLRNAVNRRLSGRSPRHQVSCPDLGGTVDLTGSMRSVPSRCPNDDRRPKQAFGVLPSISSPAVDSPHLMDERTRRDSSPPAPGTVEAAVGLTVYRSYSSRETEPLGSEVIDDGLHNDERDGLMALPASAAIDAVSDIRIYRRSAALYNDDEDDECTAVVGDGVNKQNKNRIPPRSRSDLDVISNGAVRNRHNHVTGRRNAADNRTTKTVKKSASATADCGSPSSSGYRVSVNDFPDAATVEDRLRRFEGHFVVALTRRYRSLSTAVDRLSVVSVAIHLQSRPRRTVSLYQYLTGGVVDPHGHQQQASASSSSSSASTVPVELLDPNGDNTGEYIVTIPDGLFNVIRAARLKKAAAQQKPSETAADAAVDSDELELWDVLGDEIVRCVATEAGRELSRMFEYQIGLLAEDTAVQMLAEHAVECAAAYIERQQAAQPQPTTAASTSGSVGRRGGVWERNSVVRGAVFGAVFGHTESASVTSPAGPNKCRSPAEVDGMRLANRPISRQVSVVVGQVELKWDIGDILKRPGLRRDRLLYSADISSLSPSEQLPPIGSCWSSSSTSRLPQQLYSSTSRVDGDSTGADCRRKGAVESSGSLGQLPSVINRGQSDQLPSLGLVDISSSAWSAWTYHVSAACDAKLYGYRGPLLDWDYFAHVYAPVPDDDGWFDQAAPPALATGGAATAASSGYRVDSFHRLYWPRRCLIGTELMQAYCSGSSSTGHPSSSSARRGDVQKAVSTEHAALSDFVRSRLGLTGSGSGPSGNQANVVVPVYRPLKALSLGTASRLRRADFSGSDLTRLRLVGADLRRTGLRACTLSFSRLTAVRLGLSAAHCAGIDLSYSVLDDVELPADLRLETDRSVTALYATIGTTVCFNSPDVATEDADIMIHAGSRNIVVCGPDNVVATVDEVLSCLQHRTRESTGKTASNLQPASGTSSVFCCRSDVTSANLQSTPVTKNIGAPSKPTEETRITAAGVTDRLPFKAKLKKKKKKRSDTGRNGGCDVTASDRPNETVSGLAATKPAAHSSLSSSSDDFRKKIVEKVKKKKFKKGKKKAKDPAGAVSTLVIVDGAVEGAAGHFPGDVLCPIGIHEDLIDEEERIDCTAVAGSVSNLSRNDDALSLELQQSSVNGASVRSLASLKTSDVVQQRPASCDLLAIDDDVGAFPPLAASKSHELVFPFQKSPNGNPCRQESTADAHKTEADLSIPDRNSSLSPVATDTNSPAKPGCVSPPLPAKIYSKNTNAGYLADVHGSLPVLAVTDKLQQQHHHHQQQQQRDLKTLDAPPSLPKAASLQGNQLLTVTTAAANSNHKRHLPDGRGRPLSRLDVEYINRSQIFKMIADLTLTPIRSVLPEADKFISGRKQEISDVIDLVSNSGRVVTVTGGYGVGKSALAISVAHALSSCLLTRSPVVSLLVDLTGCSSTEGAFQRLIQAFQVRFRFEERRYLYNWINAREQKLMIIFDNTDDFFAMESDGEAERARLSEFVDELVASVRNIRVLCTGQKQFYRGVSANEIYRLGDLKPAASKELLQKLLPDLHAEGVESLAESCGHVPLALRVVSAALMPSSDVNVDIGKLFESLTSDFAPSLPSRSVAEAVARLASGDDFQVRRLTRIVTCLLTVLESLGATSSRLLRLVACYSSDFDVQSAATISANGRDTVSQLLTGLKTLGLIFAVTKHDCYTADGCGDVNDDRYRLSKVLRLVLTASLSSSEFGRVGALCRAEILRRLSLAVDLYHEGSDDCYRALDVIRSDYDNIVDVLWKTVDREDSFSELTYLATVERVAFVEEFLPDDLYVAVFEAIERESLVARSTSFAAVAESEDNRATADVDRKLIASRAAACLSYRHSLAGRTAESLKCAERAVSLATLVQPAASESASSGTTDDHNVDDGDDNWKFLMTLGTSLYFQSRVLWAAGERRKAIATAKLAFETWRRELPLSAITSGTTSPPLQSGTASVPSADPPVPVAAIYVTEWYAWTLTQSDNFQSARHCYNLTDATVRDKLAGHPLTIDGLDCRRMIWDRLSLFERAATAARGAADAAYRFHGDHPRSAALLARVGDSIVKRGALNDAVKAVVEALRVRLSVLGSRHPDTASSFRTLASLMLRSGQYDQADRFARAALDSVAAATNGTSTRRNRVASDSDQDDDDDEEDEDPGRRMCYVVGGDRQGIPLASEATESLDGIASQAKEIISQAKYRLECRSSVFVQLETRIEQQDDVVGQLLARKL